MLYAYGFVVSFNASFYMDSESDVPGYCALSFVVASYPGEEA